MGPRAARVRRWAAVAVTVMAGASGPGWALAAPASAGDGAGAGGAGGAVRTSGTCPAEERLATRALQRSTLRVDVDGDGRLDRVATATDRSAPRRCRAFVAVEVRGGAAYSLPLHHTAVPHPQGPRARVVGLPDLGDDPGAEIVVDTGARTDSQVAQMFTLTRTGLQRVMLPAFEDGTMVVEGGGVTHPRGAGCTRRGALVLSMATLEGEQYQVTRHVYPVRGDRLRLRGPRMVSTYVAGDHLTAAFPEFGARHFEPCTGRVRR